MCYHQLHLTVGVTEVNRSYLPMQETQVQSLIWEDRTCYGGNKPVHHNHWAYALKPRSYNYLSPCTQEPMLHKRNHSNEKPVHCNKAPAQPKVNIFFKFYFLVYAYACVYIERFIYPSNTWEGYKTAQQQQMPLKREIGCLKERNERKTYFLLYNLLYLLKYHTISICHLLKTEAVI